MSGPQDVIQDGIEKLGGWLARVWPQLGPVARAITGSRQAERKRLAMPAQLERERAELERLEFDEPERYQATVRDAVKGIVRDPQLAARVKERRHEPPPRLLAFLQADGRRRRARARHFRERIGTCGARVRPAGRRRRESRCRSSAGGGDPGGGDEPPDGERELGSSLAAPLLAGHPPRTASAPSCLPLDTAGFKPARHRARCGGLRSTFERAAQANTVTAHLIDLRRELAAA